jgi:uracil-DNA glycosylase
VIEAVNKHRNNVVFVLWGNYAKKKGAKVDTVGRGQMWV